MAKIDVASPLNIDRLMADPPKNRIEKVGVELEGAWDKLPPGVSIVRDMSVFKDPAVGEQRCPVGCKHVGEVVSAPMPPAMIPAWVKKHHPTKVDKTCGLHIHMSFGSVGKNALVRPHATLMAPEYQATVVEYLTRWATRNSLPIDHHLWDRLQGKSRFCLPVDDPDAQVANVQKDWDHERPGHRYTMINYCFCVRGTVECRLLCMFDTPAMSISALNEVVKITNCCLVALSRRETKYIGSVKVADNEIVRRRFRKVI